MQHPKPKMEHKAAHLAFQPKAKKLPDWWDVARMTPGVARRHLMVQILLQRRARGDTYQGVRVNDRYSLPSSDPDLRLLVRRGVLVRIRTNGQAKKVSSKRNTELHLAAAFAG